MVRAAMFDSLSRSVDKARKLISGDGKLTSENIKEPLKEIRRALLEADVSLPVVRRFIKKVEEKSLGKQVRERLLHSKGLHATSTLHTHGEVPGVVVASPVWRAWPIAGWRCAWYACVAGRGAIGMIKGVGW